MHFFSITHQMIIPPYMKDNWYTCMLGRWLRMIGKLSRKTVKHVLRMCFYSIFSWFEILLKFLWSLIIFGARERERNTCDLPWMLLVSPIPNQLVRSKLGLKFAPHCLTVHLLNLNINIRHLYVCDSLMYYSEFFIKVSNQIIYDTDMACGGSCRLCCMQMGKC